MIKLTPRRRKLHPFPPNRQNDRVRQESQPPSRSGKRQVAAYFPAPVQKQLKFLAVENDTTVQNLLAEALNDLFAKHGKPELVPTAGQEISTG